eukprot:jgi/Antlo1/1192/1097
MLTSPNPYMSKQVSTIDVKKTPPPIVNMRKKRKNDSFSIPNANPHNRIKTGAELFTIV